MRIARLFFNRNKGVGKDFGLDGIQKNGSWFMVREASSEIFL